jgi:hypothetical protein
MPGSVIQGSFPLGFGAIQRRQLHAATATRPSPNGASLQVPAHLVNVPKHGGAPLPPAVLQRMEAVFGARLGDVRVHVGAHAAALGAVAFTQGSNIHFAPGRYDPHSARGRHLLGHELAHVLQQRTGRVSNPFGAGTAVVHDQRLEAEAERMALRAEAAAATVQPSMASRWVKASKHGPPKPATYTAADAARLSRIAARARYPTNMAVGSAAGSSASASPAAAPPASAAAAIVIVSHAPASAAASSSAASTTTTTTTKSTTTSFSSYSSASSSSSSSSSSWSPPADDDDGWEVVGAKEMKKGQEKIKSKSAAKGSQKARTEVWACLRKADGSLTPHETLSSGKIGDTRSVLRIGAKKLHDHIAGLKNVKLKDGFRSGFVCAEPNAVALVLNAGNLADIRISVAYDYVTDHYKGPCPNCITWLELAFVDEDGNDWYRVRAAYL